MKKSIIIVSIIMLASVIAITAMVPDTIITTTICQTCGWTILPNSNSMGEWLNHTGTYGAWYPTKYGQLHIGDVCIFRISEEYHHLYKHDDDWKGLIIHRIVGINRINQTYYFRGDNNAFIDFEPIPLKRIWVCLHNPRIDQW